MLWRLFLVPWFCCLVLFCFSYFICFLFLQGYRVHNCIKHNQQTVFNLFVSQYLCVFFYVYHCAFFSTSRCTKYCGLVHAPKYHLCNLKCHLQENFNSNGSFLGHASLYLWIEIKGVVACFVFGFCFRAVFITKGQFSNSTRNIKNCSEIPWGAHIQVDMICS